MKYDYFGTLPVGELDRRMQRGMRQVLYVEPMGTDVLFGASMPTVFEIETNRPSFRPLTNDEVRYRHGAGLRYVVYSDVDRPPADVLRNASTILPVLAVNNRDKRTYEAYLQGKDLMSGDTRRLAAEITRNKTNWYDKAVAIEAYLRTEYDYTLQMVAPPDGVDPIHFFLRDRKAGHCEYFSSAMTMMLRTLDIPARNVNGFLGGAWNEYEDYIAVRGGDAHSWVEVYFPEVGWVTFDPTPASEGGVLGRGGSGLLEKLQRFMDTLRLKWFQWVIEYDLHQQLRLFKSLRGALGGGAFKRGFESAKAWVGEHKQAAASVLASMLAAIALVTWWRRRKRLLAPLVGERPLTRAQSALAGLWLQAASRYGRRGHKRPDSATPREFARELQRKIVPGAGDFRALTELYYDAIYGGRERPEALSRARYLRDAANDAWKSRKRRRDAT
jgi:hypothetical protein